MTCNYRIPIRKAIFLICLCKQTFKPWCIIKPVYWFCYWLMVALYLSIHLTCHIKWLNPSSCGILFTNFEHTKSSILHYDWILPIGRYNIGHIVNPEYLYKGVFEWKYHTWGGQLSVIEVDYTFAYIIDWDKTLYVCKFNHQRLLTFVTFLSLSTILGKYWLSYCNFVVYVLVLLTKPSSVVLY